MINGIQHIGIGVRDRDRSYGFYNNGLGFSVPMSYSTDKCSGMLPVIHDDETRNVVIALNPHGGGLVEIFQYLSRDPVPMPEEIDYAYNGYLFFGLKVKNIEKSLKTISRYGGSPVSAPTDFSPMKESGWKSALFKDPDGIQGMLLEYPESTVGYGNGHSRIGGIEHVAIGVSNLKESIDFYSRILGYEDMLYSYEGESPEWDPLFGRGRKTKRALLRRNTRPQGLFRHFLRGGMIELIEVEGNKGRHNFEGRKWGDIGFMELCFDVTNIDETLEEVTGKGIEIAVPPHTQEMGLKTNATFAYIKDPDGSLIEFADISRLPVPYFLIRLFVNPFCTKIAKTLKIL